MCAVNCDAIGNSMLKRISESCLDTKDHLGPASFMGEKKIQMERSKVGLEHFSRDSETPFSILSNFLPCYSGREIAACQMHMLIF